MRCSFYGIGVVATTAYAFGILIPGIIFMSKDGQTSGDARKILDDATANFTAANNAYLAHEARLVDAQDRISSANCYVNQYQGFVTQLGSFCAPAAAYTNSISTLNQKYNVQIIDRPNESSTNSYIDYEYYYVTVRNCDHTDANGNRVCKDERERRTHYFTVVKITNSNYGTMIVGPGASLYMGCGKFDQGVAVATNTARSSTGMNLYFYTYDVRTFRETITYKSSVSASIKADNQPRVSSNEIATSAKDFQQIAAQTLNMIDSQCKMLNNSLQQPAHYVDIVVRTTEGLPGIRNDIENSRAIKDQLALVRDGKQAAFDSVDAVYKQTLVNWLLPFFLPTTAFILLLCMYKDALTEKHVDTQDCCKPSVKLAIPVALRAPVTAFRSRKNNSRTNIDQTPEEWLDIEQQASTSEQSPVIETAVEVIGITVDAPASATASVVAPPVTFSNLRTPGLSEFSSKQNGADELAKSSEANQEVYYDADESELKKGSNTLAYI